MLRRFGTSVVMLLLAAVTWGCTDQPSRATGPWHAPSFQIGVSDIRHMIDEIVPSAGGYLGTAQGSFGNLENALTNGGTGQVEALAFQTTMLGLYELGVLVAPAGMTIEEALINLMNAVFTYANLPQFVIPEAPSDPNAEYVIEILTDADYDENGKALVKTNFGNAAMIVAQGDFAGPVILSIIEKVYLDQSYVFPLPPGIQQIAKVYEYASSNELLGEPIVSICDLLEVANAKPKWVLHDLGNGFAQALTPNATGHTCPDQHASARRGGSFWARGLDVAGAVLGSVFSPKPLYASHSLAHAVVVDGLSPWTVGESIDDFTVSIARVKQPGFATGSFHATFPKQGALVLWLEIKNNGVIQACDGGRLLTDVEVRPTTTSRTPNVVGTWSTAVRCELVNGSPAWVVEMANPVNNAITSGVIDVKITGTTATPQLTYEARL